MGALEDARAALERVKAAPVSPDGMPSPEEDAALTWRNPKASEPPEAKPEAKKPKRPLPKAKG